MFLIFLYEVMSGRAVETGSGGTIGTFNKEGPSSASGGGGGGAGAGAGASNGSIYSIMRFELPTYARFCGMASGVPSGGRGRVRV